MKKTITNYIEGKNFLSKGILFKENNKFIHFTNPRKEWIKINVSDLSVQIYIKDVLKYNGPTSEEEIFKKQLKGFL